MGLDMYLYCYPKKFKIQECREAEMYVDLLKYRKDHPEKKITLKEWMGRDAKKPDQKLIDYCKKHGQMVYEVAYWRKANAIHAWFERNCANGELEDCTFIDVTEDDLLKLLSTCNLVLSRIETDSSYAEELLPTQSGFFFGSTEYDNWYIEDLKETIDIINRVLDETDFNEESIAYYAWW